MGNKLLYILFIVLNIMILSLVLYQYFMKKREIDKKISISSDVKETIGYINKLFKEYLLIELLIIIHLLQEIIYSLISLLL